jgi:hypothetical protein
MTSTTTSTVEFDSTTTVSLTSTSTSTVNINSTVFVTGATSTAIAYATTTVTVSTVYPVRRDILARTASISSACTVTSSVETTIALSTSIVSVTQTIQTGTTVFTTPTNTVLSTVSSVSTIVTTLTTYSAISATANVVTSTIIPVTTTTSYTATATATVGASKFILQATNSQNGAVYYFQLYSDNFSMFLVKTAAAATQYQLDINSNFISVPGNTDLIMYVRPFATTPSTGDLVFFYSATNTANLAAHSAVTCTIDPLTSLVNCINQQSVAQTFILQVISPSRLYACATSHSTMNGQYAPLIVNAIPVS